MTLRIYDQDEDVEPRSIPRLIHHDMLDQFADWLVGHGPLRLTIVLAVVTVAYFVAQIIRAIR